MSSSRISTNAGFAISDYPQPENQPAATPAKMQSAGNAFPTAQSQTNPTETLAARSGLNSAANQRFALQNRLAAQQAAQIERQPRFKTTGGEWGRDTQTGKVEFYRTGFPSDKIEKFDEEFYLPDSEKYPLAANGKYVRLNSNGDLNSAPEFKDKPKPENVSQFDWQGFEWTDAAQVPAEYVKADGKIAFENKDLADNQLNAIKRFVVDNNLVQTWDEAKFQQVFGGKAGGAVKLELEAVGERDGKTVFNAKMSEASAKEFRVALAEYRAETGKDAQGGIKGQQEATRIATDIGGALYETGRKVVDAAINAAPDALNAVLFPPFSPRTGTEPNFARGKLGNYDELASRTVDTGGKPPIPRLETDLLKYEFQSEMLRRGVFTGKVDEGIKTGDVITTAASIAAPVAIAKVLAPIKAPQTLNALEAFPNFRVKQGKWNYFFDRNVKPDAHNTPRAIQNKAALEKLGILDDARGKEKLLDVFEQGLKSPTKGKPHESAYGITVTKHVKVSDVGGMTLNTFIRIRLGTQNPKLQALSQ